jgi:hypothetical protein
MTAETVERPSPSAPLSGVDKALAAAAHGGWLVGLPVVPAIISLVWGTLVRPSAFLRGHALQALIFHVCCFVGAVGVIVLAGAYLLGPYMPAVWSALLAGKTVASVLDGVPSPENMNMVMVVALLVYVGLTYLLALLAVARVFEGRPDAYPLIGRFFR